MKNILKACVKHCVSIVCMSCDYCGSRSTVRVKVDETAPHDVTNDEISSAADVCDPDKYREVFKPRHKLCKWTRVLSVSLFVHHVHQWVESCMELQNPQSSVCYFKVVFVSNCNRIWSQIVQNIILNYADGFENFVTWHASEPTLLGKMHFLLTAS